MRNEIYCVIKPIVFSFNWKGEYDQEYEKLQMTDENKGSIFVLLQEEQMKALYDLLTEKLTYLFIKNLQDSPPPTKVLYTNKT